MVSFGGFGTEGFTNTTDPYELLGVSRNASLDEVRASYLKLARSHHPDKLGHLSEDEKKVHEAYFQRITVAYQVVRQNLTDAEAEPPSDSGVERWGSIWQNIEQIMRDKDSMNKMKDILKGTFQDVASHYARKLLPRRVRLPVSLEDVYNNRQRKVQVKLSGCTEPMIVVVECGSYPKAVIHDVLETPLILDMEIQPHDIYELSKEGDIIARVPLNLDEYLEGKTVILPSLDIDGSNCTSFQVAPFPNIDDPILIPDRYGWKEGGRMFMRLTFALPKSWGKIEPVEKGLFISKCKHLYMQK